MERFSIDRRRALAGLGAGLGLSLISSRAHGAVRLFASAPLAPSDAGRTLVLLQLSGGNDGLSTVVPYADDLYAKARPTLARKQDQVLPLDDYRGLHSSLKKLRSAFDAGRLAIVEGAGYPSPIRSHFKSLDVWHTADLRGRDAGEGWIGRLVTCACGDDANPNLVVHVGPNVPYALSSRAHPPAAFVNPQAYRWAGGASETEAYEKAARMDGEREKPRKREGESSLDFVRRVLADGQASSQEVRRAVARYRTDVEYPNEPLAISLRDAAALVEADTGTRVISVELTGFDTHTDQRGRHDTLMKALDGALGTFLEDLGRSQRGKATVVLAFSEFGRRVRENGARGTDHGVAAPMFVMGHAVKGGLHGAHPSLEKLDDGDLAFTTDFRGVYAAVIERCFGVAHAGVLGERFKLVPVV